MHSIMQVQLSLLIYTIYISYVFCCRLANPGRLIDDDDEDIYLDDDWTWNGDKRLGITLLNMLFI